MRKAMDKAAQGHIDFQDRGSETWFKNQGLRI